MTIGSSAQARVAVVLLVIATSSHVRAQTPEAEALFREGKRLLAAGEIERACEKFEASERIEAENGTELNLADCWERAGRTASAWAMFVKAAASAKRDDRAAEARRRAALLESKLVHLTIEVPADVDRLDLAITRNDQVVDRGLWNQPVPVDPGEHTITASAPRRETWSATIKVKTKDKVIAVPELERATARKRAAKKTPEASNRHRGLTIGLALGGSGAIAIATGFAIHSKDLQDRSDARCPMTSCDDAGAVDLNHRARREAWIANIGWGLGGAAIAGAIVAWSMGSAEPDRSISIAPVITDDRAGLAVGGRF
jgi:hypothetical protein